MKKLIFLFLPLFLFSESLVWKIEKNDNIVYIGGTIHILRNSDYPLPIEYNKAYNKSEKLYFETDLSGISEPSIQQSLFSKMLLKKGKTLSSLLSKDIYKMLDNYCKKYSINIKDFEPYKPAMLVLLLTVTEIRNMGFVAQGVDDFFEQKALKHKRKVGQLETIEEQLEYISFFGEGNENNFVLQSLKDLDKIKSSFTKMISSWRKGDTKSLNELFIKDLKRDYPNLYKTLLVDRNNNWLPIIKSMFNTKQIEFVLVGSAHLIGSDGIINQLKKDGYKIEKVK